MLELYLHSHTSLRGLVLNEVQGQICLRYSAGNCLSPICPKALKQKELGSIRFLWSNDVPKPVSLFDGTLLKSPELEERISLHVPSSPERRH
jgi:hypothetical protein